METSEAKTLEILYINMGSGAGAGAGAGAAAVARADGGAGAGAGAGAGVIINFIADLISIPYFVKTKAWDVVIMLSFLLAISISKLLS